MYIFKYALKSILSSKARNILIGIILVVIAISSCIALSIKNAADQVVQAQKDSNDIIATLSLDRKNLQSNFKKGSENSSEGAGNPQDFMANVPTITTDMIKNYGNSNYLKSYYYTIQINTNSTNIQKVTQDTSDTNGDSGRNNGMILKQNFNNQSGDFKVIGYSSLDAMSEFVSGTYKITDGSMFDIQATDNPCVISDELADKNTLKVGSQIVVSDPNDETKTYNLKVVGIYNDSSENSEDRFSMFSMAANQILVPNSVVENIAKNDTDIQAQITPAFVLKNYDDVDNFKSEISSKGLSEYYSISTNQESVEKSVKPIENLSSYTKIFLIIVLIIGAIILFVLNMINIKDRKYEIGVLRAIGMKKHLVLSKFILETLVITTVSMILGIVIGSLLSVPTANYMLKNQISSTQNTQDSINKNFGGEGAGPQNVGGFAQRGMISTLSNNYNTNYIDKINAVVSAKVILQILLIGLLLTFISSSVSMIYIIKFSPLKILSNRS